MFLPMSLQLSLQGAQGIFPDTFENTALYHFLSMYCIQKQDLKLKVRFISRRQNAKEWKGGMCRTGKISNYSALCRLSLMLQFPFLSHELNDTKSDLIFLKKNHADLELMLAA